MRSFCSARAPGHNIDWKASEWLKAINLSSFSDLFMKAQDERDDLSTFAALTRSDVEMICSSDAFKTKLVDTFMREHAILVFQKFADSFPPKVQERVNIEAKSAVLIHENSTEHVVSSHDVCIDRPIQPSILRPSVLPNYSILPKIMEYLFLHNSEQGKVAGSGQQSNPSLGHRSVTFDLEDEALLHVSANTHRQCSSSHPPVNQGPQRWSGASTAATTSTAAAPSPLSIDCTLLGQDTENADVQGCSQISTPSQRCPGSMSMSPTVAPTSQERGRTDKNVLQNRSFCACLFSAQNAGIITIQLAPNATSETQSFENFGVIAWEVHDVEKWWDHAKEWHETEYKMPWTDNAFFMRLRRLGFRPFNTAPAPAKLGFDFNLKRKDVARYNPERTIAAVGIDWG